MGAQPQPQVLIPVGTGAPRLGEPRLGLKPSDVHSPSTDRIYGGAAVETARKLGRGSILLRVWREDRSLFVPIEVEARVR